MWKTRLKFVKKTKKISKYAINYRDKFMIFDDTVRTNYRDGFHRFFVLQKTTKKGYVFMTGSFLWGGGRKKRRLLLHY